jgi:hypothetical protein
MSNFVGYKPSPLSLLVQGAKNIFKSRGQTPTPGVINKVDVAKNLKKRLETKQAGFKSVDDQTKGTNVDISKKSKIKKEFSKAVSDVYDKYEKKAKGGRIGYKRGTGLMPKKKSNVDKIKKTFGPKNLGMQSVIYGLDKNPKITKADPKAKFIAAANKKKKKVI